MAVYDRVKFLIDKRKMTVSELEVKLGFGQNYIYSLKKKKPTSENLKKIADYFGTTTDYLLERVDSPFNEKDVNRMLSSAEAYDGKPMSAHDREVIKAMIKGYMESKPEEEK